MTKLLQTVALTLILLGAFYVRLYKIDNPVADWHSWRQADTAAVARNFFREGFNPFFPKGDDMSSISETFSPNLQRYRFVEFPIYPTLVYLAYFLNNGVDEKLARLINVFFSLGSVVFIYLITKRYFDTLTGLISSAIFSFLPFNVFFSRVILPEPSLVFFSLGMFYFVDRYIYENKLKFYITGLIFTASAFLTKPMAVFYLIPLVYSIYQKEGKLFPLPLRYLLFFVPAMFPLVFWRLWMSQFPDGIPRSQWLLNADGIRYRPAFWKWIFQDRLGREILSAAGVILLFFGLLVKPGPGQKILLHLLAISSFAYLLVFATGNVTHDYYQVIIVPALSIFSAVGFVSLIKGISGIMPRIITIPVAVLLLFLTFYLTWKEVAGLYQINNYVIVEAGKKADELLPKEAIVIAPYGGDTAFLYQVNRPGFPISLLPMNEMIEKYKVTHFVSVSLDAKTKWLMKKFTTLYANNQYAIIDLTKENPNFPDEIKIPDELNEPY